MRVAISVWDGRVSPVFDVSREALLLDVENGEARERTDVSIAAPTEALRVERLTELEVETLVCGAISESLQHELNSRGVEVIGFVAGDIAEVVASFIAGELPSPSFTMPGCAGCGGRQRRFRGGRGQGGRRRGGGRRGRC